MFGLGVDEAHVAADGIAKARTRRLNTRRIMATWRGANATGREDAAKR